MLRILQSNANDVRVKQLEIFHETKKAAKFYMTAFLSGKRDSNSRPQPWQGCALPLSYSRLDQ